MVDENERREDFDPAEVALAEVLDAEITRTLAAGPARDGDPLITWLSATMRSDPPVALGRRIHTEHERRERQRWRPVQIVASLFAANLLSHGFGNLFIGAWVSRGIGEAYSPHAFREGGFALMAVGLAVAAGAVWRRWLPVSVVSGVPLGLSLGIYGIPEIGKFGPGAALHLAQGALAVTLGVLWWRANRYGRAPTTEGET